MAEHFFELYDTLINSVNTGADVSSVLCGKRWTMASVGGGAGLAMSTEGESIPPLFPQDLAGLPAKEAAQAVKSWNFREAGQGLAVINAALNTTARLEALGCALPIERHYTEGIDMRGRTVGLIGHMHGPKGLQEQAKQVYIIEKSPQPGDYPDSACDYILPLCDLVIITGSSLVNKTLPHLLELCRGAYTILTGPSVPLCPELLDMGLDRIGGLVLTETEEMGRRVLSGERGSPYPLGTPFLLKR